MLTRREAREQAFAFVFEKSFSTDSVESVIACAKAAREDEIAPYARKTAKGVFAHVEEIDGYIAAYSRARRLTRLSRVVLAALRLSIYEILYVPDLDPRISINEAVELTKKFGEKEEARFVNGVLAGFMRAYQAGEIVPGGRKSAEGESAAEGGSAPSSRPVPAPEGGAQ